MEFSTTFNWSYILTNCNRTSWTLKGNWVWWCLLWDFLSDVSTKLFERLLLNFMYYFWVCLVYNRLFQFGFWCVFHFILIWLTVFSWFHPNLNRHHAEALLIQNGQDGSYLLRESTTNQGEYSLSVRCANTAKHFQIGWDGTHYTFGMGRFSSLKDFVEHFENKPLIGGESGKCKNLESKF